MRTRTIGGLAALVVFLSGLALLDGPAAEAQARPLVDLVFIIDESGTMGDDQADVKARVNEIVADASLQMDPSFALVGFGDDSTIRTLAEPGSVDAFSAALSLLVVGGDGERGVAATIHATTLPFRTGARPCFLLITDEDSDGGDLATARNSLDDVGATWFGVVNPIDGNTRDTYGPNAGSLSAHTNGLTFSINSFRQDAGPVLDALVETCAKASTRPPATRTITGRVVEWSGEPLEGVTLYSESGWQTTTNADGSYSLSLAASDKSVTSYSPGRTFQPEDGVVGIEAGRDGGYDFVSATRWENCVPHGETLFPGNPTGGSRGLVLITHGWGGPSGDPAELARFESLRDEIDAVVGNGWDVAVYDWSDEAAAALLSIKDSDVGPFIVKTRAQQLGPCVGRAIADANYTKVHLIAHSAGSHLIERAARQLDESATIHQTFLDPFNLELEAGAAADFAEQYVNTNDLPLTNADDYPNMFSFNGTDYWGQFGVPDHHSRPVMHYICSVAKLNSSNFVEVGGKDFWRLDSVCTWRPPEPDDVVAGFELSLEHLGDTAAWADYPECRAARLQAGGIVRYTPDRCDLAESAVKTIDFVANVLTTSYTGLVSIIDGTKARLQNFSPVWMTTTVDLGSPATHVAFDYEFVSTTPVGGLLQVSVDGVPLFAADERYALPGLNSSGTLPLHETLQPGPHEITFRVDPLNEGESSIVEVSNVRFVLVPSASPPPASGGDDELEPDPSPPTLAGPPPTAAQVAPLPAFLGTVPLRGLPALLVTGREVSRDELVVALRLAGCGPQVIAVLQDGRWSVYIEGAPSQVNAAFPGSLADRTPFFIRC